MNNEDYSKISAEELDQKIDDKIKSIMGDDYDFKPKEYRWDDNGFMKYKEMLAKKLKEENPYWAEGAHEEIAERDLPLINPIFEKNLVEYINGDVYTDIPVGSENYTLRMVLSLRNNRGGVLEALKDLSIYSVDEQEGKSRIMARYALK